MLTSHRLAYRLKTDRCQDFMALKKATLEAVVAVNPLGFSGSGGFSIPGIPVKGAKKNGMG